MNTQELEDISRQYGKQRINFAKSAKTEKDWEKWEEPKHSFPFIWTSDWHQSFEYKVSDYEAEVGFYTDLMGLDCKTISEDYAMFTGPNHDFFFSVRQTSFAETPTGNDAICLEFMIQNLFNTVKELKSRGIIFYQDPKPSFPGSLLHHATFLTPNQMVIRLLGLEQSKTH